MIRPFPIALIRESVEEMMSEEKLRTYISRLPREKREELRRIAQAIGLDSEEEIAAYLSSAASSFVQPRDRQILSKDLLKNLKQLKSVSYADEINQFIQDVADIDRDLVSIIIEALQRLWVEKYQAREVFKQFELYKEFEAVLFKDPRYRDHFIHQFQVFLTGLPIIDNYHDRISKRISRSVCRGAFVDIDFSWLLAATFHDIGYPVQQFDALLATFFREFLSIEDIPVWADIGRILARGNFQRYVDELTSFFIFLRKSQGGKARWKYSAPHRIEHDTRSHFMRRLIEGRNHGVVSALTLLDKMEPGEVEGGMADEYEDTVLTGAVMPAALAILLHDTDVYSDEKIGDIRFEENPLSFLLIYCDAIQEWGRPVSPNVWNGTEYDPLLTEFGVDGQRVHATLTYHRIVEVARGEPTNIALKEREIQRMFTHISSKDPLFEITLRTSDPAHSDYPTRTYRSRS